MTPTLTGEVSGGTASKQVCAKLSYDLAIEVDTELDIAIPVSSLPNIAAGQHASDPNTARGCLMVGGVSRVPLSSIRCWCGTRKAAMQQHPLAFARNKHTHTHAHAHKCISPS